MRSFLIICGTTCLFWTMAFPFVWKKDEVVESGTIDKIGLLSSSFETLKSEMVVEWLRLSKEEPVLLKDYDLRDGKERLLKGGLIKEAALYKLPPSSLIVSYVLREPFAMVGNWYNCAVDQEGILFPFAPFFTPKELPEIVFSSDLSLDFRPFEEVKLTDFSLAKSIFFKAPHSLTRIDLSRLDAHHPRGGEIILTFASTRYLRVWRDEWEERLRELSIYLPQALDKETIDLRLPSKAIFY